MNTFSMIVRDRMREFAVLRSIGAAPGQVFGTVITEALGLGVLGSAIGVGLGAAWMQILITVFNAMGKPLSGYGGLNVSSVLIGVLTGVVVSFVSAVLPSRLAALTPPIEAMNETVRPERPLKARSVFGFILLVIGVGALVLAARYGVDPNSVPSAFQGLDTKWAFGVGAGLTLIGAIVFAPAILPFVVSIIGWPVNFFVRPVGQLASENVTRNRRRSASTAGALVIGMAIVALFSTAAASIKTSTANIVESHVSADFSVQSTLFTVPNGVVTKLGKVEGVSSVVPIQQHSAIVNKTRGTVMRAADNLFGDVFSISEYQGENPHKAILEGEAVLGKDYASTNKLAVGDTVDISKVQAVGSKQTTKPVTLKVGTVLKDSIGSIDSNIVMPAKAFDSQFDAATSTMMSCYIIADKGVGLTALHKRLDDVVKPYYVLSVLTKQEQISYQGKMIDQITTMLYALLALSVFIALLGIANTLALSVAERTREIGLLRAVGLGKTQLRAMFMIESVLISLLGTLIGMAVGVGIGSTLPGIFSSQGLTELTIPWNQIVLFLVVSVVIGVVASVGPSRKALKIPVLAAIVTE
jgi:putative ABC transport system permease protein